MSTVTDIDVRGRAVEADRRVEAERLLDRLEDPRTAAALHQLLDNVELLAVLLGGLDGLARRGEVIGDTVAEVLAEARAAGRATGLDPVETSKQLATLIPVLAEASPAIERILASPVVEPEPIEAVGEAAMALVSGMRAAETAPRRVGLFGLFKASRDPDVQLGLGYVVEVARAFGQDLRGRSQRPSSTETPA